MQDSSGLHPYRWQCLTLWASNHKPAFSFLPIVQRRTTDIVPSQIYRRLSDIKPSQSLLTLDVKLQPSRMSVYQATTSAPVNIACIK